MAVTVAELRTIYTSSTSGLAAGAAKADGILGKSAAKARTVGNTMTRSVSLPVALAIGGMTKKYMEFGEVQEAIVSQTNLNADQVDILSSKVLKLGGALGTTPTENMAALLRILSSGVQDVNKAYAVMIETGKLNALGLGETDDIARALTATMNTYGVSAEKAARILHRMVTEGAAEASEYANTIGIVMGAAERAGVPLEDLAATVATITTSGVTARRATQQVRALIDTFTKKPSKGMSEGLAEIGTSIEDVRRGLKEDYLGTLLYIDKKTKGRPDLLASIIGNQAARAAFNLTVKDVDKARGIFSRFGDDTDVIGDKFKDWGKTDVGKAAKASANFSTAMIKMGKIITPVLLVLADVLETLVTGFTKLPKPVQKFILIALLAAAILGPLLLVGGMIVGMLLSLPGAAAAAGGGIAMLARGVMAAATLIMAHPVVAIIALIAILLIFAIRSKKVRDEVVMIFRFMGFVVVSIFNKLKDFLVKYWPYILGAMAGPLGLLVAFVIDHWRQIWSGIVSWGGSILSAISQPFVDAYTWLVGMVAQFLAVATQIGTAIADGVKAGVGDVAKSIIDPLNLRRFNPIPSSVPFLGKKKAWGGSVASGSAYVVGERGPEMFSPDRSGRIIPNGEGGSGTLVKVENMHIRQDSDIEVLAYQIARKVRR